MGQHSAIEWTDHTFNPWWGCVKVSPGCTNCYAETWAKRYGHDIWGINKSRRIFSDRHWEQPFKWNKEAQLNKKRARVFCASMADVFEENPVLDSERLKLWTVIEQTPMLDWLLLTKRPENMKKLAPWESIWPKNVWAMATAENQAYAEKRIPYLIDLPANVRGLSLEPLLGPIDLSPWIKQIQWAIVGGESGIHARAMNPDWIRDIRDQCLTNGVAFFFKQWGNWMPSTSIEEAVSLDLKAIDGRAINLRMERVSKKNAGRQLDGLEWNQLPKAVPSISL